MFKAQNEDKHSKNKDFEVQKEDKYLKNKVFEVQKEDKNINFNQKNIISP